MADPSTCPPLTRASVVQARELIRPHVHLTPVLTSTALTGLASAPRGGLAEEDSSRKEEQEKENEEEGSKAPASSRPRIRLWFKCENLQRAGAFKARGAFHAVERLKADRAWVEGGGMGRGVVTHSSGESCCSPYSGPGP